MSKLGLSETVLVFEWMQRVIFYDYMQTGGSGYSFTFQRGNLLTNYENNIKSLTGDSIILKQFIIFFADLRTVRVINLIDN